MLDSMNATGCAVQVRGLVKRYGGVTAVSGIDLEIAPGEVFALLGPNGAGKPVTGLWLSLPPGRGAGPAGDWPRPALRCALIRCGHEGA